MQIMDVTTEKIISDKGRMARNFFQRLRGLIARPPLEKGESLFIPGCQGVHTYGMTYAIDIVFLNDRQNVVKLQSRLVPNRIGPVALNASAVIELPAGSIDDYDIRLGDNFLIYQERLSTL